MNEPIEIPNKSSFKINEVCALTGVKSYVLRFWESEFTEINPLLSSSGQKLYEHRDIEAILLVKKLLFDDKLSIERARGEMKILMPREHLVESSFDEYEEFESQPHKTYQTKRVLIDSDIQKLVLAKNKLTEILSLTETLHQRNNW
jgi:DNA-binding transcriptional MerR regulator